MIAPTIQLRIHVRPAVYSAGRRLGPGARALAAIASDEGAVYDKQVSIEPTELRPMVTFGTSPGMGIPSRAWFPDPAGSPIQGTGIGGQGAAVHESGAGQAAGGARHRRGVHRELHQRTHFGSAGRGVGAQGTPRGSGAARSGVPGSHDAKRQAEAEGLDVIFLAAGAEWREPGCSMCLAMNGDQLEPASTAFATSNRNSKGRQGKAGVRFWPVR